MTATGFQFGHNQWSGKKGAAKKSQKWSTRASHGTQRSSGWSAADILAEAARLKGHCEHVPSPKPPGLVYGVPLDEVEAICDTWAASKKVEVKMKDGTIRHRKMRSDAPILASGVISFPKDRADEWPQFRDHAVQELEKKHGKRLRSVVEHLDESHPHLHFYLVPLPGEDFGIVHDGYAASRAARSQPGNKIRTAFQDAMRKWQDWLHESIGAPFGLARIGPARARLDNEEWKESEKKRALEQQQKQVDEGAKQQEAAQARIDKLLADVERREGLITKKQHSIDMKDIERTTILAKKITDANKTQQELDRLVAENDKSKTELRGIFDTLTLLQQQAVEVHQPKILETLQIKVTKATKLGL